MNQAANHPMAAQSSTSLPAPAWLTQNRATAHDPVTRGRRSSLGGMAIVALFTALYVGGLPWLTRAWAWALQTGVGALNLNVLVAPQDLSLPWGLPVLTRLTLVGPAAQPGLWGSLAQVAVCMLAALALRHWRRQLGPWAWLGQTLLALCGLSVVLFAWWPQPFSQHLAQHTGDLFAFDLILLGLIPLVLGLTFFALEARWHLRLAAVTLTLGYFVLCLPIKLLAHAWLIGHLGAGAMPVLFLCLGPALDVLLFVAIYAWMASWRS